MEMCYWKIFTVLGIFIMFLDTINGLPRKELSREKRTSDQRLAELETLFALSKMHGKFVTVPIGFGKIDPSKLMTKSLNGSLEFMPVKPLLYQSHVHSHGYRLFLNEFNESKWKKNLKGLVLKHCRMPLGRRRRSIGFLIQKLTDEFSLREGSRTRETFGNEMNLSEIDDGFKIKNFLHSDPLELMTHQSLPEKLPD